MGMIGVSLVLLLVLLGVCIPVGAALGLLGLILEPLYSSLPLARAMGEMAWGSSNEFLLVAIPLHLFGFVMTLRDDRIFEILFVKSTKCPPRSRAFWAADSYSA